MKRIIYGVVSFCLLNCLSAWAADQEEAFARINDIHLQTQHLQHEVDCLRAELCKLKKKKKTYRSCLPRCCPSDNPGWNFSATNPCTTVPNGNNNCQTVGGAGLESGFTENNREFNDFARRWGTPRNVLLLAAIGSTVTTSPFLGLRSAFDASDLIVNLPTMNEDLRFLKEKVLVEKKLNCYGLRLPDRPIIELGGEN